MGEELKFLKAPIEFDVLLAATREAVELYFVGDGIPVKYDISESTNTKKSPAAPIEGEKQAISSLIDFLSYRDDGVQEQAITTIIKRIPSDINEIREKGGIKPIVKLLSSTNETLQSHAAKALSLISADEASKDAVRNCGAIPDIFNALQAAQVDRIKGLLLGTLLHLISCERNLPAIRACGGIPIVLSFLTAKLLPIQVASAQIISHLAPSNESQFEITKAGGLRKIYKALRCDQMLQKEALKILTIFSKNEKGRECILITKGGKYILHMLRPELIIEMPPQNVRNSYMRSSTRGTVNFRSTLMAGRVKTQTFNKLTGMEAPVVKRKNEKPTMGDKNELVFQRMFQQVIFAIVLNLASSEKCRKNLCELGGLALFSKYLAIPPAVPIEIVQLALKAICSLTTSANTNPFFGVQNNPLGPNTINMLLQLAHVKDASCQFLVASILDNLAKLPQYQSELGIGVPTLLRLLSTVDTNVKKIILRTVTTLASLDNVKKTIFDGAGIPTLTRIFSTNQSDIFPNVAQLLTVITSNDAMRKAIVFTGSIGHLLTLITNTHEETDLDIFIDTFSRLPVDEDGIGWIFHEEKCLHSLTCLLYSHIPKVKLMAATTCTQILINDGFKFKFDEAGGTQAMLVLMMDKNINVQVEAIKGVTKLIQTTKIRKALIDAGLIDKVKEIGKHENVKGAGMETAIVQALRGLIVQIKVATQSATSPVTAKKPAETVWIKCRLGTYAKMAKVQVGDSLASFISTVLTTYNVKKVQLTFVHGGDEMCLQSDADFDYIIEQNKNDKKVEVIVREVHEVVVPVQNVAPTVQENGGTKLVKAYMDIQHSEMISSTFKPQVVIPVEPPKPLAVSQILDIILRPLREDEIWCICFLASKILFNMHKNNKLHKGIRHECLIVTLEGDLILEDGPFLLDRFLAPETTDPSKCTTKSDVYGLGACLWTCADFLLDDDEEPNLSQDLLFVVEQMTDDDPSERPNIDFILQECAKYENSAIPILKELMKEVERKKLLKRDYESKNVEKQVELSKNLLGEIRNGIQLKQVTITEDHPPKVTSGKSLLFEIENAVKTGTLRHVETPKTVRTFKRHRGTFLTDIETESAKRNAVIVEQTYVEGMKLWARDIGKWNEEMQKVFMWHKNMVRLIFRLVEIVDDRVSFEEYVRILQVPKGQKLLEFMAAQPPIPKPQKGSKFFEPAKPSSPQISPRNITPNTQNPRTPAPNTNTNNNNTFTLGHNRISQKPATNPAQPASAAPPLGVNRTISSPVFTRPAAPSPTPSSHSPSSSAQAPRSANTNQVQSNFGTSLASRPAPSAAKPPGNDGQISPRAKVVPKNESPRNSLNLIVGNRNPNIISVIEPIAHLDESIKDKLANALTRVGFSVKYNRYVDDTKEHKEYLDIFRPEDLPLTAFLKSILICLKATHLVHFP